MKKQILILVLQLVQTTLFAQQHIQRSNCAAGPEMVKITQPDGSEISYYTIGNESVHYFKTQDDYTILPNKFGIFEYAVINANGNLVPSGVKAHSKMPAGLLKRGFVKNLTYSSTQIMQMQSEFFAQSALPVTLQKNLGEFPSLGTRKICVILVDFADEQAPYPLGNFDNLMNQTRYQNTGSFKDAFIEYSNGQFTPVSDVYGWFRVSLPRASYGRNNADGSGNPNYMANVRALVLEAINKADSAGVDFSQYDNDNDGDVDGLIIFHAGFGAEQGLNGYIWSHRSSISPVVRDGKIIRNYCINPAKRNWGGQTGMVGIGVVSHEFGHILGLPDLYDTNNNSAGTGNWGLMGGGPWLNQERTPCHFEPWCKMQLQWLTPTVINQAGTYTLKNSVDSNFVYRVNTPNPNEYFILENKQRRGFDAFTPGRGLAIWHINTARTNLYPGSNTVNTDTSRYGVGLKQADGLRELERNIGRGNAADLYPGTTNNRNFTPNSNPSSSLHPNAQGERNPSHISITNITQNTDSTITFTLGNRAVAAFSLNAISGCAPFTVNINNISTFANSFMWQFGNGQTSNSSAPPPVVYTQSGNYTIKLTVYDSAGVAVDSSEQNITVQNSPKARFTTERGDSNTFTLRNQSEGAQFIVWRIGENQSSTAQNPVIRLTENTSLPVRLIAYSPEQCTDTAFNILEFWPLGINENNTIQKVSAFPNPFNNDLSITFNSSSNQHVSYTITNAIGQILLHGTTEAIIGSNQINIKTNELPRGIFIITIKQGNYSKTLKVTSEK
jgi:immune inhibitor A